MDSNLFLLFELCITATKANATTHEGTFLIKNVDSTEISCGWALFPLFTIEGSPIENKTYELKLHGGNPFDLDVELPLVTDPKSMLSPFNSAPKPPRLVIRVWKLSAKTVARLEYFTGNPADFLPL